MHAWSPCQGLKRLPWSGLSQVFTLLKSRDHDKLFFYTGIRVSNPSSLLSMLGDKSIWTYGVSDHQSSKELDPTYMYTISVSLPTVRNCITSSNMSFIRIRNCTYHRYIITCTSTVSAWAPHVRNLAPTGASSSPWKHGRTDWQNQPSICGSNRPPMLCGQELMTINYIVMLFISIHYSPIVIIIYVYYSSCILNHPVLALLKYLMTTRT